MHACSLCIKSCFIIIFRYYFLFIAVLLIKQVIEGVSFLHANNILHRDLSLRNLLLTDSQNLVVSMFILSTDIFKKKKNFD